MDINGGAKVGLAAVLGGGAGLIFGFFMGELIDFKRPGQMATAMTGVGALAGAIIAGTFVATTPASPTTPVLPAAAATPPHTP